MDPEARVKKGECELCYEKDLAKLIRKPTICVSRPMGYLLLCPMHNKSTGGYKETIRCECFNGRPDFLPAYISVYDPCSCQGKIRSELPTPDNPSKWEYLFPPEKERKSSVDKNERTIGCDRCSKKMKKSEIYAECKYCDDVYCSYKCASDMGSVGVIRNRDVFEAICWACNDSSSDGY